MPKILARLKNWWATRQAIKHQIGHGREVLQALQVPCADHTNGEIIITIMAVGLAHLYGQKAIIEARALIQNADFGRVVEIVPLSKGQLH